MNKVRCAICRRQLPNLKRLRSHYISKHSKIQIIRQVLKFTLLNATPNVFAKSKKRRQKYKTIYLHDKVQITYNNDTIMIEDASTNDNLIELTFDEAQNYTFPVVKKTERKPHKKIKKPKRLFHMSVKKIVEVPKTLHESTGEFYECHCMEKPPQKTSSDTDSGSDTGKLFYCSFCGSGYHTLNELTEHENMHQYYCKLCNKFFNLSNHSEHLNQHIMRIYVCHVCGFEFNCREVLIRHFEYHFEQQTFENVLDMEEDYNVCSFRSSFTSGNYQSNMNTIMSFLTQPYDPCYTRNMFKKIVCDLCYQEIYVSDYFRHLQIAHFVH